MDVPIFNNEFKGKFSDAPKNMTPYKYFQYLLLKNTAKLIAHQLTSIVWRELAQESL